MRFLEWLQLTGMILYGNIYLWLVMKKSSVSRTRVLCLGKVNENPGRHVHVVQEFTTTQNFGHNWWWAGEIRVEYFPRIHHIAAVQQSPRVQVKNVRRARRIHRTDHLHVDVQRHLMGISRQWTGMRIKRQPRFYLCEKIFTRKIVIPRTCIRKEVVFHSW